jgi:hypothetical protein
VFVVERGEQQHLFAEAGAGGEQRSEAAVGGEFVGTADGGDDVLLDARAVAAAFDDLEVAARAQGCSTLSDAEKVEEVIDTADGSAEAVLRE